MFKDTTMVDDDGLSLSAQSLKLNTEEEDANDCRVAMGKMKRYFIVEVTQTRLFLQEGKTFLPNSSTTYR